MLKKARSFIFALIAISIGLFLCLALIEGVCRLLPISKQEPAWPSRIEYQTIQGPILYRFDHEGVPWLRDSRINSFWPWAIPAAKSPRTFRIIVLGGSAAYGLGYAPAGAFPAMLEKLLQERHPDREIQVINLASVGFSSEQVRTMARIALDQLDPDLLLIYSGNNELLDFRAMHQNWSWSGAQIRRRLWLRDHSAFFRTVKNLAERGRSSEVIQPGGGGYSAFIPDEDDWDFILSRYARNLSDVCLMAKERSIPVILTGIPVNLEICNRLDLCFFCDSWTGQQPEIDADWSLDQAFVLWDHGRPSEALALLADWRGQDADLLRALILRDLGEQGPAEELASRVAAELESDEGRQASPILTARYMVALDLLDRRAEIEWIYPALRQYVLSERFPAWDRVYFLYRIGCLAGDDRTWRDASSAFMSDPSYYRTATARTDQVVRSVAEDFGATLVDLPGLLSSRGGQDHVGYGVMVDYCHFNHRGAWLAAAAYAEAIEAQGWIGPAPEEPDVWALAERRADKPWRVGHDYAYLGDWLGIDNSLACLVHRLPSMDQRWETLKGLADAGTATPLQRLWLIHHQAVRYPEDKSIEPYLQLALEKPDLDAAALSAKTCSRWAGRDR